MISRTLMSAWIETFVALGEAQMRQCRTLMSAWIETGPVSPRSPCGPVALS